MKQLIADLQVWLLGEGRCSGCGRFLEEAEELNGKNMIVCTCSRLYVYNNMSKVYEQSHDFSKLGGDEYAR